MPSAIRKIPFIGDAVKRIDLAKKAIKQKNRMAAIHHGAAAAADITFPPLIGKVIYDMSKDNKMRQQEAESLRRQGFLKESSVLMDKLAVKIPGNIGKKELKAIVSDKPKIWGKGEKATEGKPGRLRRLWNWTKANKKPLAFGAGGLGLGIAGTAGAMGLANAYDRSYRTYQGEPNKYRGEFA